MFYKDKGRYALLVDGARQVGKTFIIKEFAAEHYDILVEINFATMNGAEERKALSASSRLELCHGPVGLSDS